ncbi:hypothetical protein C8F01DRAFT_980818, partial [Mycena amicta]
HFLTQIPHPMHRNSEMNAILSVGFTSMHSFPEKNPEDRLGLHLFESTMAIRVILSAMTVEKEEFEFDDRFGSACGLPNPNPTLNDTLLRV